MNFLLPFLSAFLFSLATPFSKMILNNFNPILMAGLCYFSASIGLMTFLIFKENKEAKISRKDILNISVIILCGGTLAPLCLFKGLATTDATTISILLNMELIFTSIIASFCFGENTGKKFWIAAFFIFLGGSFISFNPGSSIFLSKGSLYAILACLLWSIDNNFTAKLSIKDPYSIAITKGFVGGLINITYYLFSNEKYFFEIKTIIIIFFIGIVCYGASLVLFIYSMRQIGASGTITIFSTYPFLSFLLSILILKEKITFVNFLSFISTIIGIYLILTLKHSHKHFHLKQEHEHLHTHNDGHHNHHTDQPKECEHSHLHTHPAIEHEHEHQADIHHKHH